MDLNRQVAEALGWKLVDCYNEPFPYEDWTELLNHDGGYWANPDNSFVNDQEAWQFSPESDWNDAIFAAKLAGFARLEVNIDDGPVVLCHAIIALKSGQNQQKTA